MRIIRYKKIKIGVSLFFIGFVFMCLLTSCIQKVEINQRGLIESMGIDFEDGRYEVLFQLFNTSASIGSNGAEQKESSFVIKSDGKTIMEAMKKVGLQQDKQLFYRITNIIILGKNVCCEERVFKETIDFLNKVYMDTPNVYVGMAEGEAKEIIEAKIKQSEDPSNFIQMMLKNAQKQGCIYKVRLKDLVISLDDFNTTVTLPNLIKREIDEETDEISINGINIIKDRKFLCFLSVDEVKFLSLLDNKNVQMVFSVNSKKYGLCNFSILKKNAKIKKYIENNKPRMYIDLDIESALLENDRGYDIKNLSEADIKMLEATQKKYFFEHINKLLEILLKKYNVDLIYFKNSIYRNDYNFWNLNQNNWDEVLSQIQFSINVETHISRSVIQAAKEYS